MRTFWGSSRLGEADFRGRIESVVSYIDSIDAISNEMLTRRLTLHCKRRAWIRFFIFSSQFRYSVEFASVSFLEDMLVAFFHRSLYAVLVSTSFIAFAACASSGQVSAVTPRMALQQSIAQCKPDFALSVNPSSASIQAGASKLYQIGLTSVCGLAGSINVGTTNISPADNGNGPRPHQARYDIPLQANGKAGVPVTFSTSGATLKTTYTITITAKDISGGCCYGVTHTASISLIVK